MEARPCQFLLVNKLAEIDGKCKARRLYSRHSRSSLPSVDLSHDSFLECPYSYLTLSQRIVPTAPTLISTDILLNATQYLQPQHISESPDLNFQISSSCVHQMFYRHWSRLVCCFLTCPVSECPALVMLMEASLYKPMPSFSFLIAL